MEECLHVHIRKFQGVVFSVADKLLQYKQVGIFQMLQPLLLGQIYIRNLSIVNRNNMSQQKSSRFTIIICKVNKLRIIQIWNDCQNQIWNYLMKYIWNYQTCTRILMSIQRFALSCKILQIAECSKSIRENTRHNSSHITSQDQAA